MKFGGGGRQLNHSLALSSAILRRLTRSLPPIKPEPRIPTRTSETRPFLQRFGVSRPMNFDLRGSAIDLTEIVGRELDGCCSDVLLETRQLRRAGDGNDPRLLCKQPGERDLSRCGLLPLCDLAKQINDGRICLPSLGRKARNDVAKVGT